MNEYVGTICECQRGILGLVTDVKTINGVTTYHGIKVEEGGKWQSIDPKIRFYSLMEFIKCISSYYPTPPREVYDEIFN